MKKLLLPLTIAAALVGCSQADKASQVRTEQTAKVDVTAEQNQQTESQRLNAWFEEQFEKQLQESPLYLTFLGRKERYDEMDDFSEANTHKQFKMAEASVNELKTQFDYDKLTEDAKISYDIWLYQYELQKKQLPFLRRGYVLTQMQGLQSFLPSFLINYHRVDEASDMQAYITRISGVSRAMSQLLERSKVNAAEGVRPPYFAYEGVIQEARAQVTGKPFQADADTDAPLWADAQKKVKSLLDAGKIEQITADEFLVNAEQQLIEKFQPAFSEVADWFEADLVNVSKEAQGLASIPDGEDAYNMALLSNTTTAKNAEEIHQLGLTEVARIHTEMEKVKSEVAFEGSLQAFFSYIKTSKGEQFYYPNTDEGRQGYIDDTNVYLDYINSKLPEYFGILPKAPLVVKRVEPFREQPGAAQHYFPGTPDGSRPGTYYAHLSDMSLMPKNEMEAIAYHEGNPGHHMQISIAQELESVPTFRTQARFTAYSEGWGLYAELLASEMGAYEDPFKQYGQLASELWRAVRLVVDTGIHAKGWTEQQAIDYCLENTSYPEGQIRSEVRRYFVLPGQATSYKIGMLKILELRAKAREALGDKFDIRGFHDTVLGGGAVPLPVLERLVNNWVEKQKSA
jgi:uncharacterized protein (DUF885 family)